MIASAVLTVDDADKLYVPAPPVPVPSDVMTVPAVTPVPVTLIPTPQVPVTVPPTVSTVVAMVQDVAEAVPLCATTDAVPLTPPLL